MRVNRVADLPDLLTLRRGERCAVELPSMTAAGYRWIAEVDGCAVAITRQGSSGAEERPDVGSGTEEVWVLTGRTAGRARIRLRQRRPWDDCADRVLHVVLVEVVDA
jgi:predicted secreted protein